MLANNNISVFLMATMPAILYAFFIYAAIPKNMISIGRARRYLVAGLLSPMLIFLFHFLFPDWGYPQSNNVFTTYFIFAFIQVGLLEEITKYTTFQWVSSERNSEKNDLPIAIMFYSMMSSVGFSIVENISYLINYRNSLIESIFEEMSCGTIYNPIEVQSFISDEVMSLAFTRAISAVILHMLCGIIMGYFLVKSHREKYYHKTEPDEDIAMKNPQFKRWYYVGCAIVSAAILHGVYDLNLMLPQNMWVYYFHVLNIFGGLLIGFLIIKLMIKQSKELRKNQNVLK